TPVRGQARSDPARGGHRGPTGDLSGAHVRLRVTSPRPRGAVRGTFPNTGPRRRQRARGSLSFTLRVRPARPQPRSLYSCLTPLPSRSRSGLSPSVSTSTKTSPEAV